MASLEERTLVVRNFDQKVSRDLLFELFNQAGPVVNIVLRSDFAFVEFEHKVSVGYALALFERIYLFGRELHLEPKVHSDHTVYKYCNDMLDFNHVMSRNPDYFLQFMPNNDNERRERPQQSYSRREFSRRHSNYRSFR